MTGWGPGNPTPSEWAANHGCPTAPNPTREPRYPPTRTFLTLRQRRRLLRTLGRIGDRVRREQGQHRHGEAA